MPFNVHLADNEDAIIQAKPGPDNRGRSTTAEFVQGVVLGILFVVAAIGAYWMMQRFADFQSFVSYWIS